MQPTFPEKLTATARRSSLAVAAACLLIAGTLAIASSSAKAAPRATTAAAPACATSGLVIWLETPGNGAAGSVYYKLKFTNLSGHTCTLDGYPGVSAVSLGGAQLGSAATRERPGSPRRVTLASGASATATLRIVQAGNFPEAKCHRTTAAGLRVYPPGQSSAKTVPFPFEACARRGPTYLSVQPISKS